MRIVQLALVLAVGFVGCHKTSPAPAAPAIAVSQPPVPVSVTEETDGEPWPIKSTEFLELIPADTPYVLAQNEPLPPEVVRRFEAVLAPFADAMDQTMADATKKASADEQRALDELFGGVPTIAKLGKIGIDLNPRFVIYGLGFAPVIRVRLGDAAALERAMDRLAPFGKDPSEIATFHGQRYRYDQKADGSLTVIAIVGPDLVITVLPPGEIQRELLPLAFGQKLPETAMSADDRLARVRKEHGLGPHVGGYVDIEGILAATVGQSGELNRRVAAAYPSFVESRSPECVADAMRLARAFPRLVFGYDEISAKRIVGSGVLEMPPDIARHTKPIPGPIPGLGDKPKQGTLATFGVGIDMKAVERAAKAYAAAVQAEPFRCPEMSSLNELGQVVLSAPALVPKPLLALTGFGVRIDDFDSGGGGDPRVDGVAVVGVEDPRGALDAAAQLLPGVELGKLRKPRTPVQLASLVPAGGTPPASLQDAWIAYGKRSIAVSFGNVGKRELLRALDRVRPGAHDLALWSFDLGLWLKRNPEVLGDIKSLEDRNAKRLAEAFFDLLGRSTFIVRMTDRGVETEVALELPKR